MRTVWGLVLVCSTALAAAATIVVVGALSGDRPRLAAAAPVSSAPHADGRVDLAGSGSNLPLTRLLADAFNDRAGHEVVRVHQSIGSRGGVRAVLDGAVDLGLVSRPLLSDELGRGVRLLPYAAVEVVWAANRTVPERALPVATLIALHRGERTTWSDGSPAVLFLREAGDSGQAAFEAAIPGFAEVAERARRDGDIEVLYRDIDMQDALVSVPGAVGLFDRGAIEAQDLPLLVLPLVTDAGGAPPTYKTLAFATVGEPSAAAAAFLEFVYSEAGRAICTAGGYEPLPRGGP